jgi:hypothetical protein
VAFKHIRPASGIADRATRVVVEDLVREVTKLIGQRGSDRVVTRAELVATGLVKLDPRGVLYDPDRAAANAFDTGDYSVPPAPTNVSVTSSILFSTISWDAPTYHHHSHTEVWVSATDNLATARKILDAVGTSANFSLPADIGTSGYAWVRFVSIEKVSGLFNSTSGTAINASGSLVGLIAMWSGAAGTIPSGWQICDGTGVTPDLRDKFIIGASIGYPVGSSAGATTDTSDPPSAATAVDNNADGSTVAVGSGTHTHEVDILPPYYALYYIMYTG